MRRRLSAAPLTTWAEGAVQAAQADLGRGEGTFRRARAPLRGWQTHRSGWLRVVLDTPPAVGLTVLVCLQAGPRSPLRLAFGCRVTQIIDEPRRWGFVYTTLPGHPEHGKGLFLVEWQEDDKVVFRLLPGPRPAAAGASPGPVGAGPGHTSIPPCHAGGRVLKNGLMNASRLTTALLSSAGTRRRVFTGLDGQGGKAVTVFPRAVTDPQTAAAHAGTPLSVFVEAAEPAAVHLRVFTPAREKGSSDSAALAALTVLQTQLPLSDLLTVTQGEGPGAEDQAAQLCGGEWLLRQGEVQARPMTADLSSIGLAGQDPWLAQTERPTLVVQVNGLATLDAFAPDDGAIRALGQATGTTGLVLHAPGGPDRALVSFRAFAPLRGFAEDAASSNMLACLVGTLGARGDLPADTNLLRAAQRMPGQPARLSAQFAATAGGTEVWVGGRVVQEPEARHEAQAAGK
ncbi:DUF1990 family protein [Deinococcus sp. HMF7620]|uniref:DUF1990 family protein n=1 Tax=Deinococcus arboris TaxID=2682977 RepID=A0A7C9M4D1_9DEIO|nr:DUF1990 family protein [Deinococcus arboris]MVN88962.1 DUF1990 family protein [Deinococcus arboris]